MVEKIKKNDEDKLRETVREEYGKIARNSANTSLVPNSCCGPSRQTQPTTASGNKSLINTYVDSAMKISKVVGYSDDEIESVPNGANLGLGCGNPTAHASLKEGETVLDLGSGGGFDCFLAANKVGKTGKVIGVDMTSEMLDKAKLNAKEGGYDNVEFRLGEIEHLPVADNSVDVIISNCVINLSPNKEKVFQEAYRVLKSGGRMFISDIVILKNLPDYIKNDMMAYVGCVSGAIMKDKYLDIIKMSGFKNVEVQSEVSFPMDFVLYDLDLKSQMEKWNITENQVRNLEGSIKSIKIKAYK